VYLKNQNPKEQKLKKLKYITHNILRTE